MKNESVEIIRFKVAADTVATFVALRTPADEALCAFKGFVGSELLQGPDDLWTVLVRWASRDDMLAAQAVTLGQPGLPEITAWTAQAVAFVSFETAEVRRSFENPSQRSA